VVTERIEIAVVGLGALGSSALWRLAERGVKVVGFERFPIAHALGSTHGATRLFREACLEHSGLTPIAQLSRSLFRELEGHAGEELLRITGGVMIGDERSDVVAGTRAAASAHSLAVDLIDAAEISRRYPQQAGIRASDVAVLDPGAGVAFPEPTVRAAVARAQALGARVLERTHVVAVEPGVDGVHVRTEEGEWLADRVVLTEGAWLAAAVPALSLHPIRTPMTWFTPADGRSALESGYGLDDFPVFVRQLSASDVLWGHGAVGDVAGGVLGDLVKAGVGDIWTQRPPVLDPDRMDRGVTRADWHHVSRLLQVAVPAIDPVPARVDPCMITLSPDDQFVVGVSPTDSRIVVGGGDSGHAFKHAPALGELLARAALGEEQPVETDFIDPARFSR
jgi:sarcosine oxidase